jgi:ribosome-associated toxin RatA of RatAB toxin-antitoxin module
MTFPLAALCLALALAPARASDPSTPHPHQGLLKPISSAPAGVKLTEAEQAKLAAGKPVLRQSQGAEGGSGVAIQEIAAPAETVWDTILNYPRYKDWVENVVSCTVYRKEGSTLYLDMQTSILGIRSGMYTRNVVRKDQGYMSWTLDYSRKSDVNDIVGYWRVETLSTEPPRTRLEYSTQLMVSGVPTLLVGYLTRDSLVEGTGWVKKQAEAAWSQRSGG